MAQRKGQPIRKKTSRIKKKTGQRKRPRLPSGKITWLGKVEGAARLQKICAAFGIPFEPIRVYRAGGRVKGRDLAGADRIILRLPRERREFITKNASPESLDVIANKIEHIAEPKDEFLVQKAGLRDSIESYGAVRIDKLTKTFVYYTENSYEKAHHNLPSKSRADAFFATDGKQTTLKLQKGKLDPNARKLIDEKIGSLHAHEMVEHLSKQVEKGKTATLRFVRYRGKAPCFYDMSAR